MAGWLGINNFCKTATVMLQETIANFGFANSQDGRTNTRVGFASGGEQEVILDFGSSKTITALGIARHNIGTVGGIVSFYISNSSNGPWATPFHTISGLLDDKIIFRTSQDTTYQGYFTAVTGRYCRIYVTGHSANLYAADIYIGERLALPCNTESSFQSYEWCDNDEIISNLTHSKELVGLSFNAKLPTASIKMDTASVDWMNTNYDNLRNALKSYPIYWTWREYGKPAFYCWPEKKIGTPRYTEKGSYVSFEIKMEGITQ